VKTKKYFLIKPSWTGFKYFSLLFGMLIIVNLFISGCETTTKKKKKKIVKKEGYNFGHLRHVKTPPHPIEDQMIKGYKFKKELSPLANLKVKKPIVTQKPEVQPFYMELLKKSGADDKATDVTINFSGAKLGDVVPAFAQILKFNYSIDPICNGSVTMSINAKLTQKELWKIFEQMLWMCGTYCSSSGDLIRILPQSKMSMQQQIGFGKDQVSQENVELLFYPLRYADAKKIVTQLKPFTHKGGTFISLERQNAIMLVDSPANIPKMYRLLKAMDQRDKLNWHRSVTPCHNVSSGKIIKELSELLPVLGFKVSLDSQKPTPGSIHLNNLERLQVIIASAATEEALLELKRWVEILDKADVGEQERVYIFPVVNGKADELAQALSVIFPVEGASIAAENTKKTAAFKGTSAAKAKKSTAKTPDGPSSVFEIPAKIFADSVHNRLVIRTTPRSYAMMKAVIERLDTIPTQVLLQVLVVEVSLTKNTKFGMEFSGEGSGNALESIFGTNYNNLVPSSGQNSQAGGKFWIFNPKNPNEKFGYIQALAGNQNVKVVSSPQVLAISHTKAKISVGSRVPLVQSEISNSQSVVSTGDTESTSLVRNIEYFETGIILEVTPHVSRGGRITIDIDQTVSEAVLNTTSAIDSPEISERLLQTSMSIRDGQTIIIGGLIKEQLVDNLDTVPFLGKIPILRRLIGDSDLTVKRTELLMLITGTIITQNTKLEDLLKRYRVTVKYLEEFQDKNDGKTKKKDQGFWDLWS
jgi:general secretion pathway protein D